MALHPDFPASPYSPLVPAQRWFPADEALRSTSYEKLLPPLVAKVREEVTECRKRGASRADVLAFEFEMGLFPAVLDEAKHKGIDLAPKTIPPEVFDKRAVEKGQVRFHDVAYIEVTPRIDKKNKLALAVELSDFSVYYSQGIAEAIAADLKEGKSEVVCEQGKLIKVSKDKHGIVSRDVLTKKWTDWVDYWAVDFDYESRKEIIKQAKGFGVEGELPGVVKDEGEFIDFEERWTGAYTSVHGEGARADGRFYSLHSDHREAVRREANHSLEPTSMLGTSAAELRPAMTHRYVRPRKIFP